MSEAAIDSDSTPRVEPRGGTLAALGWAVFLGMSWTWCIGMFLPVILVREMGFWGWFVFAIPNVIGAAAMGWVLRDAGVSKSMTDRHAVACSAFSAVTILFQIFFAGWVVNGLIGHWAGIVLIGVLAAVVTLIRFVRNAAQIAAGIVFLFSAAMFVWCVTRFSGVWSAGFPNPLDPTNRNTAWLTPVCLFGFALCPYLDLTFHQARQGTTPGAGRAAFGLGFAGPFFSMIVFTLWYSRLLTPLAAGQGASFLPSGLKWAIALHMAVQLGYTIAVHWVALGWKPPFVDAGKLIGGIIGFVAGILPQLAGIFAEKLAYTGLSRGEIVYRLFLSFYGLVFPAYVWICVWPTRAGANITRRKLAVFGLAVTVAGPMFWMGFIDRQMVWLAPGVGIVLLARLLVLGGGAEVGPTETGGRGFEPLPARPVE